MIFSNKASIKFVVVAAISIIVLIFAVVFVARGGSNLFSAADECRGVCKPYCSPGEILTSTTCVKNGVEEPGVCCVDGANIGRGDGEEEEPDEHSPQDEAQIPEDQDDQPEQDGQGEDDDEVSASIELVLGEARLDLPNSLYQDDTLDLYLTTRGSDVTFCKVRSIDGGSGDFITGNLKVDISEQGHCVDKKITLSPTAQDLADITRSEDGTLKLILRVMLESEEGAVLEERSTFILIPSSSDNS